MRIREKLHDVLGLYLYNLDAEPLERLYALLEDVTASERKREGREAAEKIRASHITNTGENHEDFGPTWQTRIIDCVLAGRYGKGIDQTDV